MDLFEKKHGGERRGEAKKKGMVWFEIECIQQQRAKMLLLLLLLSLLGGTPNTILPPPPLLMLFVFCSGHFV